MTESSSRDAGAAASGRIARPPLHNAALWIAALLIVAILAWQGITAGGNPNPVAPRVGRGAAVLDIGVLVFREGLECVLVLAAITASMTGAAHRYRRPIATGVLLAIAATLVTWRLAAGIIDSLAENFSALQVQAATGLLAIVVLLIVMNWFFHKMYWTGWIAAHTRRKRALLRDADRPGAAAVDGTVESRGEPGAGAAAGEPGPSERRIFWGLAALGFTSFYREGFEVVLFLQNYRLELGGTPVLYGVLIGSVLSALVALLTLVAHRRLPHRKMLVLTGILLGGVLLVMVGEQAQEMQLAHWLPTTPVAALARMLRPWLGTWFAVFPTVETLTAQGIAAVLVLGSYTVVQTRIRRVGSAGAAQ